ncbi:MAG: DUF481 domain-containing protein [Pseudomonadota bacterium]
MRRLLCLSVSAFVLGAHAAASQEAPVIPDIAAAMLEAAEESGNAEEIAAVARAVKAVFPDYAAAIDQSAQAMIAGLSPNEGTPEPQQTAAGDASKETPQGLLAVSPWDGKISASGVLSSGNSDNAAVGVAIDAARTDGDFTHNFTAYFDLGESNNVTNQKRWGAAYQLDYNFGERTFAYGRFAYDEDEFSGFDYRLFAGAGLGHFFVKSDAVKWKLEGGPGYRYSPIDDTREVEQNFAVFAASELDWVIREGVTLEQDVNVTWSSPTTTLQSVTALTTKIWGDLSTGLSFEYRFETDPPEGRENTDTIAKASLIYGF